MTKNNRPPFNGHTLTRYPMSEVLRIVRGRILGALVVMAILIGLATLIVPSPTTVSAGSTAPQLEGTWRTTATIADGPPPFSGLNSFNSGGTFYGTDETQLLSPSAGPAVGVWTKVGSNQYAFTWESYLFDFGTDTPTGKLKVRGLITVTDKNTYTSVDQFAFYDTDGNVTGEGCATEEAIRMTVDLLTSCPASSHSSTSVEPRSKGEKGWKD